MEEFGAKLVSYELRSALQWPGAQAAHRGHSSGLFDFASLNH
jgi:hypothetical protein